MAARATNSRVLEILDNVVQRLRNIRKLLQIYIQNIATGARPALLLEVLQVAEIDLELMAAYQK